MKKQSFFEALHYPYYIYAPDFRKGSAGIRALHYLCHALNEYGAEAYLVNTTKLNRNLRTPILTEEIVFKHLQQKRAPIVIYPEVVFGNPFSAPHVVRWLLNKAGYVGGDTHFDGDEMLFTYEEGYVEEGAEYPMLQIPTVDSSVFNNLNNPNDNNRQGSCFYANKYTVKGYELLDVTKDSTSLCQDVALTRKELADILRRSEVLYTYEPSALITEALVCGCPVVMLPSQFVDDNLSSKLSLNGLAYSLEDLPKAKETIHLYAEDYRNYLDDIWDQIEYFFESTQAEVARRENQAENIAEKWLPSLLGQIEKTTGEPSVQLQKDNALRSQNWLQKNVLTEGRAAVMAERMVTLWQGQPTFHLVMTLNAHELPLLSDTFDSLQKQLYQAWGLTIISNIAKPDVFEDLPENIEWLEIQEGINEEIDNAIQEAGLDWVMRLLPGDKLLPHGLLSFAEAINFNPENTFIYSDEITDEEIPSIDFKPDFNLEMLRSRSYLGRSAIVRRDMLQEVGGFSSFAYVEITDLCFKAYEAYGHQVIGHVDEVLLTAAQHDVDEHLLKANEMAIRQGHFIRMGLNVAFGQSESNLFHIDYQHGTSPLVSIVIANRNNATMMARCLDTLVQKLTYTNFEIIVVDQMSDVEDLDYIYQDANDKSGGKLKTYKFKNESYSAMLNYGVEQAKGEYITVLASTSQPVYENWLENMLSQVQCSDVGVVGARIIDENNNLAHGGGILGATDDVVGMFSGLPDSEPGYMDRAHVAQEYAAVSSACFIVSTELFKQVGGLDEQELANTRLCVTDFCLKVQTKGYRNVWTPFARIFQSGDIVAKTNGVADYRDKSVAELEMLQRWPDEYRKDKSFNRNLSLKSTDFLIELNLVIGWGNRVKDRPRILALFYTGYGSGEYRLQSPLRVLAHEALLEESIYVIKEGRTDNYPSHFEIHRMEPDVILLHQMVDDGANAFLTMLKQEFNVFTIFGIDDLVEEVPDKSSQKRVVYRDMRHRVRHNFALCDRVIVSTQPIADAYKELNDDIVVVPNYLESWRWRDLPSFQKKIRTDKPRVGWAGAKQHDGDLEIIFDVVKETSEEVTWVFFGMCPDEIKPYVEEIHEPVVFDAYPEALAKLDLDLAIAPLEMIRFNEAKSNLRLLEYGVMGWPVVCSDIYPYQTDNAPVIRVSNTKEVWMEAIRSSLKDGAVLKARGQALNKWVLSRYMLDNNSQVWFRALTP